MPDGAAGDGRAPDLPADAFVLRGLNNSCRITPALFLGTFPRVPCARTIGDTSAFAARMKAAFECIRLRP